MDKTLNNYVLKNPDSLNTLSDEEFKQVCQDIIWPAMYSLEGFREEKNFAESDRLRDLLLSLGIKTMIGKDNKISFYASNRFAGFVNRMSMLMQKSECN